MSVDCQAEAWTESQEYELDFWANHWPYRHLPREEILAIRRSNAHWFLTSFGFPQDGEHGFGGFKGRILEVGCGPIGFFEGIEGVSVLAIDTLMKQYAEHLPFSECGRVGNCEYSGLPLEQVEGGFDFVICSNVLDHTGDWRLFLKQLLAPVRKGGGSLLLFTHSRSSPAPGHTQVYDPAGLVTALLELGVTDVPLLRFEPDTTGHGEFSNYVHCRK